MKITQISVRSNARLSQDYQSAEGSCELTAQVEENEEPHKVYLKLSKAAQQYAVGSAHQTLKAILGGYSPNSEGDDVF